MKKTILITGSTDGIGLATAKMLLSAGHDVLLHGRDPEKLESVKKALSSFSDNRAIESYVADLSIMADVEALANAVLQKHTRLDVLINNAGVYRVADVITKDGLDIRFAVNTIAPYLLMQRLMPLFEASSRVINLSSAAQASVDLEALRGGVELSFAEAYAQSKLALTMWSYGMALSLDDKGLIIVAINPRSLLGSKMVKDAYGIDGGDLRIGADILIRAALSDEFADASGKYYDNDIGQFASPHPDAIDPEQCQVIIHRIEKVLTELRHK